MRGCWAQMRTLMRFFDLAAIMHANAHKMCLELRAARWRCKAVGAVTLIALMLITFVLLLSGPELLGFWPGGWLVQRLGFVAILVLAVVPASILLPALMLQWKRGMDTNCQS